MTIGRANLEVYGRAVTLEAYCYLGAGRPLAPNLPNEIGEARNTLAGDGGDQIRCCDTCTLGKSAGGEPVDRAATLTRRLSCRG